MATSSSRALGGQPPPYAVSTTLDEGEVVISGRGQPRVNTRGQQRTRAEFVFRDGPLMCVCLVGQLKGRWWAEAHGDSKGSKALRKALANVTGSSCAAIPVDRDFVAGVAVIRGWRFVQSAVSHDDAWTMIQACLGFHRQRSGQRFIEHEIIASAMVATADGSFVAVPQEWSALPARIAGQRLASYIVETSALATVTKGMLRGASMSVLALLNRWSINLGVDCSAILAWPASSLLAVAMASGAWFGDVSVKHRRQRLEEVTMAPVPISPVVLRQFVSMDVEVNPPAVLPGRQIWEAPHGFVRRYSPEHVLDMLRAGQDVRDRAKLKRSLRSAIRFLKPHVGQLPDTEAVGKLVAHPVTQHRSIVSVDMASMLWNRHSYKASGQSYRYLAYDASPQCGHEYFVTVERVVRRKAMRAAMASGSMPDVTQRLLPLCVLGCCRMGLAEKLQAHVHQTFLDYGPAVSDIRKANRDVRQCLSDMGTELGIADARDFVGQCLGQVERPGDAGWLYPLALVVPGPQHIIDSAIRRGLEALPWWPDWQRSAKAVCQWLRPAFHRDFLVDRLEQLGGQQDVIQAGVASLRHSVESFACWRWKTLIRVTRHLARVETAVIVATRGLSASHLSSKDTGAAAAFLDSVAQEHFWQRARVLGQLVAPLAELSSWIRGCGCHEQQRMACKSITCDWAGCRAQHLLNRFEQTLEAMDQLRREGAASDPDMAAAASAMIFSLDQKMAWLRHTPYTIWQAGAW